MQEPAMPAEEASAEAEQPMYFQVRYDWASMSIADLQLQCKLEINIRPNINSGIVYHRNLAEPMASEACISG